MWIEISRLEGSAGLDWVRVETDHQQQANEVQVCLYTDWLKRVETDHQQQATEVWVCLYMDCLTYKRDDKLRTGAVRAYRSDKTKQQKKQLRGRIELAAKKSPCVKRALPLA